MRRVLVATSTKLAAAQVTRLKRRALHFLKVLELDGVELSIAIVGDAEIRRLNRQWRNKDKATDVLSFPSGEVVGPGLRPLGDVIISLPTAKRQAKAYGRTLTEEIDRYLAHGLLHLLGHDHHRRADAAKMAKAEGLLLGRSGMVP